MLDAHDGTARMYVSPTVLEELKRIIQESEVGTDCDCACCSLMCHGKKLLHNTSVFACHLTLLFDCCS